MSHRVLGASQFIQILTNTEKPIEKVYIPTVCIQPLFLKENLQKNNFNKICEANMKIRTEKVRQKFLQVQSLLIRSPVEQNYANTYVKFHPTM